MPADPPASCVHCGSPTDVGAAYCCIGCEAAAALLQQRGLGRVRALATRPMPSGGAPGARLWLDADATRACVDVQGITCGACVWVIEQLATQHGVVCGVNPGAGRLQLEADAPAQVAAFLDDIETLGYRTGPPQKDRSPGDRDLLSRTGICAALAMVSMSFAFSRYFGLADDDVMARAFWFGEALVGVLAFVVGGSWFIASSFRALRRGIIPFDLPIAAGVVVAFAGSTLAVTQHAASGTFFDSLSMFIALMLLGRLAQERVLARNRAQLLADAGLDGLHAVRLDHGVPHVVAATAVRAGDTLLLRPGDVVPARAALAQGSVQVSLAWTTGESAPQTFSAGDVIPAGAIHSGSGSVVLTLKEDGATSGLAQLLARPARDAERPALFWQRFAAGSVAAVVVLAAAGFMLWRDQGLLRALEVATAVMVITCPCAIGLAVPLAVELGHAQLRAHGVFVRRAGVLDTLARITHVLLDKTGTVTRGRLRLLPEGKTALNRLPAAARAALYELVARSSHPKSTAVADAIGPRPLRADVQTNEAPGRGVSAEIDGHRWAFLQGQDDSTCLEQDGVPVVALQFEEELQADAARVTRALRARGLHLALVSGDDASKTEDVARTLGIATSYARTTPDEKADIVRRTGGAVLFVGDGLNDVRAFAQAACAGAPALDRPQVPARADFYMVGTGLGPLDALFETARRYRTGVRRALWSASVYNVAAVAFALSGHATPLWCAVLMPLSSVLGMGLVMHAFLPRRAVGAGHAQTSARSALPETA